MCQPVNRVFALTLTFESPSPRFGLGFSLLLEFFRGSIEARRWSFLTTKRTAKRILTTKRKSLTQECGWKGGDRGGLAKRKKRRSWQQKKPLLGTGLLM